MQEPLCLVIDDDADDREIFAIVLEDAALPCRLAAAENGIKALELLTDGTVVPDFIFLDLNMPLLSGKECLKRIRETGPFKNVPVIIYSTSSFYKDIEETKALGATHFLTKTPDIKRLTLLLKDILSKKELPFQL